MKSILDTKRICGFELTFSLSIIHFHKFAYKNAIFFFLLRNQNEIYYYYQTILPAQGVPRKIAKIYKGSSQTKNPIPTQRKEF